MNKESENKPAKDLSVSDNGIDFITLHEGFRASSYLDSAKKPTIGYGHLIKPGEKFPDKISREEAKKLFAKDLEDAQRSVRKHVKVPLTQHQFDALTSLTFNIGGEAFRNSTVLRKLNESDYDAAAKHFADWNMSAGKIDKGLVNRRNAESQIFIHGIYDSKH